MIRILPLLGMAGFSLTTGASAQTVDHIRQAGYLACGTVAAVDDWNGSDQHGNLSALGGEICRAVAIAILGEGAKLQMSVVPAEPEALAALKESGIDLVVGATPSAEASIRYGVGFGLPVFYDTQRFLVYEASGLHRASDLHDRLLCAMNNTPSEERLRDEMTERGIPYGLQAHSEQGEMDAAVAVARCAAGSALESRLAASRADFPANAPPFVFLPERFGLEPVAPAYRYGDQRFGLIVDYTISALIEAEALGITRENVVAAASGREDLRARRLLGADRSVGQALGLAPDWAVKVVAAVGNYGQVFDQSVGKPYRLERGVNALWTKGGLMRPMPMQ